MNSVFYIFVMKRYKVINKNDHYYTLSSRMMDLKNNGTKKIH